MGTFLRRVAKEAGRKTRHAQSIRLRESSVTNWEDDVM
jgi:hypothetical protein